MDHTEISDTQDDLLDQSETEVLAPPEAEPKARKARTNKGRKSKPFSIITASADDPMQLNASTSAGGGASASSATARRSRKVMMPAPW